MTAEYNQLSHNTRNILPNTLHFRLEAPENRYHTTFYQAYQTR